MRLNPFAHVTPKVGCFVVKSAASTDMITQRVIKLNHYCEHDFSFQNYDIEYFGNTSVMWIIGSALFPAWPIHKSGRNATCLFTYRLIHNMYKS